MREMSQCGLLQEHPVLDTQVPSMGEEARKSQPRGRVCLS